MFNMLLDGQWYDVLVDAVDKLIVPILIVMCSIGIIYAVVIGVKMMKAESKEDRENNKSRLINIAITIVAVVCLIAIFYALRAFLENKTDSTGNDVFGDLAGGGNGAIRYLRLMLRK